jgi:hypothetical protein
MLDRLCMHRHHSFSTSEVRTGPLVLNGWFMHNVLDCQGAVRSATFVSFCPVFLRTSGHNALTQRILSRGNGLRDLQRTQVPVLLTGEPDFGLEHTIHAGSSLIQIPLVPAPLRIRPRPWFPMGGLYCVLDCRGCILQILVQHL